MVKHLKVEINGTYFSSQTCKLAYKVFPYNYDRVHKRDTNAECQTSKTLLHSTNGVVSNLLCQWLISSEIYWSLLVTLEWCISNYIN